MKTYIRQGHLLALLCTLATFAPTLLSTSSAQAASCTPIFGSGSSVQALAQKKWIGSVGATTCGTVAFPTVTYLGTASGQAIEEWGGVSKTLEPAKNGAVPAETKRLDGFIGVEPPAAATITNMDEAGKGAANNGILTIPNAQEALAQIVTLPVSCTIKGAKTEIKTYNTPLSEVWQHGGTPPRTFATWLNFEAAEQVEGTGCGVEPKLYVRSKTALTTLVEKTYLHHFSENYTVNNKDEWPEPNDTKENTFDGPPTSKYGAPPTTCTAAAPKAPATGNETDPKLVENVYGEPATTGYVGLADAEATNPATGKPWFTVAPVTHTIECSTFKFTVVSFMLVVENNGTAGALAKFASPVGSGGTESNCTLAKYENEPAKNEINTSWSAVTQSNWKAGEGYPKCFLTYDLAWAHYNDANLKEGYSQGTATPSTTEATVAAYQKFILGTAAGQGQTLLNTSFYTKLSTTTLGKASEGQALIGL